MKALLLLLALFCTVAAVGCTAHGSFDLTIRLEPMSFPIAAEPTP